MIHLIRTSKVGFAAVLMGFVALVPRAMASDDDQTQSFVIVNCEGSACAPPSEVIFPQALNPIVELGFGGNFYGTFGIAAFSNGEVVAWGENLSGILNLPNLLTSTDTRVAELRCQLDQCLAVLDDGRVVYWGSDAQGQSQIASHFGLENPARDVDLGHLHAVGIDFKGDFFGFGNNSQGQSTPPDTGGSQIIKVAAGYECSSCILEDGSVRAWGENFQPGTLENYLVDPDDPLFVPAADIEMSQNILLVLRQDGTLRGSGIQPIPIEASGIDSPIVSIKMQSKSFPTGPNYTALRADGRLVTWGDTFTDVQAFDPAAEVAYAPRPQYGQSTGVFIAGVPVCQNTRSGELHLSLTAGVNAAASGDTLYARSSEFTADQLGFFSAPVTASSRGPIDCEPGDLFRLGGLAQLKTAQAMTVAGELQFLPNSACRITGATMTVEEDGSLSAENGAVASLDIESNLEVRGSMIVNQDASLSTTGDGTVDIQPGGQATILGGSIQSDAFRLVGSEDGTTSNGSGICIDGTLAATNVQIDGGELGLVNGTIIGDVSISSLGTDGPAGRLNTTGYLFGDLDIDAGRCTTLNDFFVVGDLINGSDGVVAVQAGTLYVSGGVVNQGQIYGEVVGAPGFQGGGQTAPGDGMTIAGDLKLGPDASIRFSEPLWRITLGGDFDVAITTPSQFELIGSTLRLDGSSGGVQHMEATSRDIGPEPLAFSDPPAGVSLIRELIIGSETVIVDQHHNGGGKAKGLEAIYASRLEVEPGASLALGDHILYCTEVQIDGQVDRPENIVVVSILPDPDFNNDGFVNGADLAFILAFWGTNAPDYDLDGDGAVRSADLGILLAAWGPQ